jgi:hypothetical protein
MLRRLDEKRSEWPLPLDIRSRPADASSTAKGQTAWTTPTPTPTPPARARASLKPPCPLERGSIDLGKNELISDLSVDMAMLVDGEIPFDANGTSHSTPPFKTALVNTRKRKSMLAVETSNYLASTSIDVGLQLLLEAIGERGEGFLYSDSQVRYESTAVMDLTLGEAPSFLDDTCKRCGLSSL